MKVWQEMKENGFLTPSVAQMPVQKKQSKKRENDNSNRKRALAKMQEVNNFNKIVASPCELLKEHNPEIMPSNGVTPMPKQRSKKCRTDLPVEVKKVEKVQEINKFTEIDAPSGLLNKLNPGIINRIRSSEQVFKVINALVRRDEIGFGNVQKAEAECNGKGSGENNGQGSNSLSCTSQVETFSGTEDRLFQMKSEHEEDISNLEVPMIKVENEDEKDESFTSNMKSESVSSSASNEKSANKASVSSLSQEGTVSSEWLQFLYRDAANRLAALRRSQMRVQNVIQTELPSIVAKEFPPNQENEQLPAVGCPVSATMKMHLAKWNPLFHQMDNALKEEAKHLEQWLNQVREMQLHMNDGFHFYDS
ncbi:uncharacterized protein LOC105638833 isoform X2 [Jatropha curcas]|nr:uncharacterized protein LOC105638833 isoform X2 [Jatropha curcas]